MTGVSKEYKVTVLVEKIPSACPYSVGRLQSRDLSQQKNQRTSVRAISTKTINWLTTESYVDAQTLYCKIYSNCIKSIEFYFF